MSVCRGERGSASVMMIGLCAIVGLVVAAVVDASAAYLRHQSLTALADGAALAAADAVVAERAYTGRPVSVSAARSAAAAYLRDADAARQYDGLSVAVTTRGDRVLVTLRASMSLPLAPPGWGDATITGRSAAYSSVG